MVCIYCIEDINDLKYVGSTTQTLNNRLYGHRSNSNKCSSSKLNLYNCIIYELESCPENERTERERYWINKIDCVNSKKLNYDNQTYQKKWRENNPDYHKNYYLSRKN